MTATATRRALLGGVVALTASVSMLVSAGAAGAAMPWWHVNTVSAPASQPGAENQLVLEVSDLGDAAVDGSVHPVSIVDTLPPGVVPLHVNRQGGGSFPVGISSVEKFTRCEIKAQVVSCTYNGPLLAYERLMLAISVQVAPGAGAGVSEVAVSGGGAPAVSWHHALALGESPPPFGAETYEITPEEEGGTLGTQAGSHPFQLTTTLTFNTKSAPIQTVTHPEVKSEVRPIALTKDLRFNLPPGLVGNPTQIHACPLAVFLNPSNTVHCPDDTAVGVATPMLTETQTPKGVPFAEAVALYNVEPAPGEPARFGFSTQVGPVVLDTSVRTGGDYGVVVTVPDIPDDVGFIGTQVTFWGVPGDPRHDTSRGVCLDQFEGTVEHITKTELPCTDRGALRPFLIMPPSCTGPLQTSVEGDPWSAIGQFTAPKSYTFQNAFGEPIGQDGCNQLPFSPSISVAPDGQQGSSPTGLTVGVHVDQQAGLAATGLADANVKDTTVVLPAGVVLNPASADGLLACGLGEIALESSGEQSCPEASKVATVEIATPLLPNPLVGAAYLATPAPFGEGGQNPFSSLLALYIVAKDPVSGVLVKIAGEVTPDPVTGQLTSTFKNTPQLPFEDLKLRFFGGSRAPLGTPPLCGSYAASASIAPWSGNPAAEVSSPPFAITSGPNGAPCANPLPFAPSLTAGSTNLQASAFSPFTMTMSREDGNQNLKAIQLHMPPGLAGSLARVALCGEAQANAGTCGPESLIGETTVSVGLGGNPYTVTGGKVYLTGPYRGAPFGLSIVNPADAGPFHLGNVIVRATVQVDPLTAALTITSDSSGPYAIPPLIKGIPLQIKHVNVTITRHGFTFNPTSCEPMSITAALQSIEGAASSLSVPFQVTNCAALAFKPSFTATVTGRTSKVGGAGLKVNIAYPSAPQGTQANIHSVKVELPYQLPSRLTTLQKACLAAVFEANPASCPPGSVVGHATAVTPILPVPLAGPAYFVSYGNAKFPELVMVLQGYGVTIELHGETFIDKHGVTSSTFHQVPDQPVTSFEVTLPQGPYSALAANTDLCALEHTTVTHKTVTRRVHGHTKRVRVTVKHTGTATLTMPTEVAAQNGAVVHQSTPVAITGCAKAKAKKAKRARGGSRRSRGSKR